MCVQYIGDRGEVFSTSGDIMSTSGDVECIGVFNINQSLINLLPHMNHDIPQCTKHPLMYSRYSSIVLMVSPDVLMVSPDALNTQHTGWSRFRQFENYSESLFSCKKIDCFSFDWGHHSHDQNAVSHDLNTNFRRLRRPICHVATFMKTAV